MNNRSDNAFERSLAEVIEPTLARFFEQTDYAAASRRAIRSDLYGFGRWYVEANAEPLAWSRVVGRDIADYREHLARRKQRAVATVNRSLVVLRRIFGWLASTGELPSSPAAHIKELRRQPLAPKGLSRAEVRKLLREAEVRGDLRAAALFHVFLGTGLRVSELVSLTLSNVELSERSGWARVLGKGSKMRLVPIPLAARKALLRYLESRPQFDGEYLFLGERGALTDRGVRCIFRRYSAAIGVPVHPHLLRHTFGRRFLEETSNDLVALASLLGHSDLNTTKRYVQRTADELAALSESISF